MQRDLAPDLNALPVHQLPPPDPFERDTDPTPWPSDCMPQGMRDAAAAAKPKERAAIMTSLPPDPRTIYTDATPEKLAKDFCAGSRPSLSWSSDEGPQFFGGHSMKADTAAASMGMFTKLYDGSGVERSRIGDAGGAGFLYGVCFGFFLSAQPARRLVALWVEPVHPDLLPSCLSM